MATLYSTTEYRPELSKYLHTPDTACNLPRNQLSTARILTQKITWLFRSAAYEVGVLESDPEMMDLPRYAHDHITE